MSLRTLLAVALLWSPAIAARDVLDMTDASLQVNYSHSGKRPFGIRKVHPAGVLRYSLVPDRSGAHASMLSAKERIFSYGDEDIECVPSSSSDSFLVQSDSLVQTSVKIAAAVDIDSSYRVTPLGPAFAASVSAGMDAASSTKSKQFRSDLFIVAKKYYATTKAIHPEKKLRPQVREFLLSRPPEDIIEKFGAFYASKIELGGLVRSTTTKTASENEDLKSFQQKAAARASSGTVQAISGGVGTNFSKSFGNKDSNSEMSIKVSTLGGDSQIWLGMSSHASLTEIRETWAESVNQENMAPIRFALKPLWSLLEDIGCHECQDRANALKIELMKMWRDDTAKLEEQDQLPKRVPGQVNDVVTFIPLVRPETRMFVAATQKKWYVVGRSQRSQTEAFKIRQGLANGSHISFESVASPGHYIAACDWWFWGKYVCHQQIWKQSDKRRATWKISNGFEKTCKSFESLFYPGYYMDLEKHDGGGTGWVRLSKPGGDTFEIGASWKLDFAELDS